MIYVKIAGEIPETTIAEYPTISELTYDPNVTWADIPIEGGKAVIKGTETEVEGTFAIKNGKYGEIKVYHSPRKTIGGKEIEGNKSLDRELETDNIWEIKKEERDLAEEYGDGYRSVEEGYQEIKSHEDNLGRIIDQDKMRTKDIDGDINTRSQENIDYNALAVKWGYYREGEPNADRAKEIFDEKRKQNPKKATKEIIEMVTEELEEDIGHNRY